MIVGAVTAVVVTLVVVIAEAVTGLGALLNRIPFTGDFHRITITQHTTATTADSRRINLR